MRWVLAVSRASIDPGLFDVSDWIGAQSADAHRAGTQVPESDALERLAGVVNVTPEWFTRVPSANVSLPLFRSNASAHVAARAMADAQSHDASRYRGGERHARRVTLASRRRP
jgi:hypothetical protein